VFSNQPIQNLIVLFSCSIADPTYNKEVALVQDKQASVKMIRSGETAFEKGKWYINDEMVRTGILALFPISL
jgi:hypothetical protein